MSQINQITALTPSPLTPDTAPPSLWGGDGLSFGDIIDAINPLQHIPVVSTPYRAATGDTISAASSMIGGGLLGGIPGIVSSALNAALEAETGQDAGSMALDLLSDGATESKTSAFAAPNATPLVPDNGEAMLAVLTSPAPAVEPAIPEKKTKLVDLYQLQDPSLGLADDRKRTQLLAGLEKTALAMKA